jgi:FtsP/CotA-like multicopper oxidase with cupredoxin domain
MPRPLLLISATLAYFIAAPLYTFAQHDAQRPCPLRPVAGSVVGEPENLRSQDGVLRVDLTYRNFVDVNGRTSYCYVSKDGVEAPTLRVKPGDTLILHLRNELAPPAKAPAGPAMSSLNVSAKIDPAPMTMDVAGPCASSKMTPSSTNLHFHGLTVPPVCHQDDVLRTMVQPGDPAFEYRFRIPSDESPGLYWYHPHVHGFTNAQVQGGASGALIVEGIERANTLLAGLPERVIVIRDQNLVNPDAQAIHSGNAPTPMVTRDAEGDILNAGMDGGKPAKDLSINFVPVSFPDYQPAVIQIKPDETQLWRLLNASAITYLDLQLQVNGAPQLLGVVSLDGVPINENGLSGNRIIWESHILVPPAGRVEFVVKKLAAGQSASFVTRHVDTGPAGENDPTRALATVVVSPDAPDTHARLDASPTPLGGNASVWIGDVTPVRTRRLYFSEQPRDPSNPNSPTDFYITVDGQTPKLFDPNAGTPDIVARQGDVEDWIIENRSHELHAFHIHQIHFMLVEWNGVPVEEPFLRDTINVAYWNGVGHGYPSVKVRMDFRDPNTVGTFVYHCHLLEHEDGGMMGLIRVEPNNRAANSARLHFPTNHALCGSRAGVASIRARSQAAVTYSATSINEIELPATIKGPPPAQNSF